jgi:hypothetical protein
MSTVKWLYRYVFRGIGFVLIGGAATILAISIMNSCEERANRQKDARQREETRKVLKRMHENADEEIRKFQQNQMQKKPNPKGDAR